MYNIRINILLDQKTYNLLKTISKENDKSVGLLVREAINEKYSENHIVKRKALLEKAQKVRVKLKGKIDYKKLTEEGRRF